MTSQPNPFHLLRLPLHASNEEIVRHASELYDLAGSDEERQRIAWARRELLGDPLDRAWHAMREVPGAGYRDTEAWRRVWRLNRRNPANVDALAVELRGEDFDLGEVLTTLLDDVAIPDVNVDPALREAPVPPGPGTLPTGVSDVLFG